MRIPSLLLLSSTILLLTSLPGTAVAQKRTFLELKAEAEARTKQRALKAKAIRTKEKRSTCRCATPRLVSGKGPLTLDESGPLSMWLDSSGARIDLYLGNDLKRGLRPAPPTKKAKTAGDDVKEGNLDKNIRRDGGVAKPAKMPNLKPAKALPLSEHELALGKSLMTTPFPVENYGEAERSRAVFHRLWMRQDVKSPMLIGMLRKHDQIPRDVVRIEPSAALSEAPPPGRAPSLIAAFLGPLEVRDTAGCGKTVTHRLVANLEEGSPKVSAWLVTRLDGSKRVSLVDARQVSVFGIGRVEGCDQGLTLSPTDLMDLEIRPVSSTFGVGEAWTFKSQGPTPKADPESDALQKPLLPTLVSAPATHHDDVSNPFIDGFKKRKLSGAKDRIAFGSMAFVVGGAVVVAAMLYSFRRRRRRRIEVHGCPACGEEMSLDVTDPETDGFFCPACGKSSVTVLQTPDGPRVRVYLLAEDRLAEDGAAEEGAAEDADVSSPEAPS